MKRTIESLGIKGFTYNPDIVSHTHSAFYDKDEDNSIEILENYNNHDWLTIIYCYRCEPIRVINFFMHVDSCYWKEQLEYTIMAYMPSELKD